MTESEYERRMDELLNHGGCKSCGARDIPCGPCSTIRAARESKVMPKTKKARQNKWQRWF